MDKTGSQIYSDITNCCTKGSSSESISCLEYNMVNIFACQSGRGSNSRCPCSNNYNTIDSLKVSCKYLRDKQKEKC